MSRPHVVALALLSATACAGSRDQMTGCEEGEVSVYAQSFEGKPTASGEPYRHYGVTAAHRTLPFGTHVEVTIGSRSVRLRINDRGPFAKNRILDVTGLAAGELGLKKIGHAKARVCVIPQ